MLKRPKSYISFEWVFNCFFLLLISILVFVLSLLYVCKNESIRGERDGSSPVRILWADVHLQQDPLGEGLEALPTLPQMPVAELAAQLAGGGRARQDSLVLGPQMTETGVRLSSNLVQQRETPRAGGVGEDHGADEGGDRRGRRRRGRRLGIFVEALQGLLSAHGFHHCGRNVH